MHDHGVLRRTAFVFAFLWPLVALRAETAGSGAEADGESAAGQLLVAAPDMPDLRFAGTVVLVVRQDKDGSFGIVVNRPVQTRTIAEILDSIGSPDGSTEGSVPIYAGGPVQPNLGFILHSAEYRQANTLNVAPGIALTSSATILRDIGHHKGPNKVLVAFGYAGWSPGQLEHEMSAHAWATAVATPALVFDADRDKLWDLAWARRTLSL